MKKMWTMHHHWVFKDFLLIISVSLLLGSSIFFINSLSGQEKSDGKIDYDIRTLDKLPENNPKKGLVFDGLTLENTQPVKSCKGLLKIDMPANSKAGKIKDSYCTHGPDPKPATPEAPTTSTQTAAAASQPICYGTGNNGPRVQPLIIITERHNDQSYVNFIKTLTLEGINKSNTYINNSAQKYGDEAHIRWVTTPDCQVDMQVVNIYDVSTVNGFNRSIETLVDMGYNQNDRKYMIFTDLFTYCGIAESYRDDSPLLSNFSNRWDLPAYSRVDSGCSQDGVVVLHELFHNLGAVQNTAPNTSGVGHCVDEHDVMCYQDSSSTTLKYICDISNSTLLDCNGNDYFNTRPAAGNYLETHWNTADSRFLMSQRPSDSTAPTQPTALEMTQVNAESVTLTWSGSTDNSEVSYEIFRDGKLINRSLKPAFVDKTVSGLTRYNYYVRAIDEAGNISPSSNIVTVDTPQLDTTPPSAPTNVQVTNIGDNAFTIAWDKSTDNVGVRYYRVCLDGECIVKNYFDSLTKADICCADILNPGQSYSVTITAFDAKLNTSQSTPVIVKTTGVADTTPPSAPTNLYQGSIVIAGYITLWWNASSDTNGIKGYNVFRDGQLIYFQKSGVSFVDQTVTPGQRYSYYVVAIDTANNQSGVSNTITATDAGPSGGGGGGGGGGGETPADKIAPSTPQNLTTSNLKPDSVSLNWSNSTDNVGVKGFRVNRSDGKNFNALTNSFTDTTVISNTKYSYTVQAFDAAGNYSNQSRAVSVLVPVGTDTSPPTQPQSLDVRNAKSNLVNLRWSGSTDNVAVARYEVYRDGIFVSETTSTSFGDGTVAPDKIYSYYVIAVDNANNKSKASNPITVTVPSTKGKGQTN